MYKMLIVILLVIVGKYALAQRVDTAFNKDFDTFRQLADSLIAELKLSGISQTHFPAETNIPPSVIRRCEELRSKLKDVDAHGWFALKMSDYYSKGQRIASQDSTSAIAQQECIYDYFTEVFRKPSGIVAQIKVALDANDWFEKGFPSNKYCPYYYAPVEVNFGTPKATFNDTLSRRKN